MVAAFELKGRGVIERWRSGKKSGERITLEGSIKIPNKLAEQVTKGLIFGAGAATIYKDSIQSTGSSLAYVRTASEGVMPLSPTLAIIINDESLGEVKR